MNAPHPLVGRRVGDYEVLSEIGQGGMGLVFRGRHVQLGQAVAIKCLHTGLTNNASARDRFVREAQALARLNHPNIISLLNFVNDDTGCYIVMEYAEGEDLEAKVQRMGLVPPSECLPWFVQACRALSYAHQQGVIHRDIKPSNIFIHPSGQTKILDFGTAKLVDGKRLTQQGMTLGTVIYMSREQVLGEPLDARSDVYSLGVTLYETVTGQLPFYDENERNLVVKIAKEEPVPPRKHCAALDPRLEAVILKSLAKDREQRYQTAPEFEAALTELMAGVQTLTAAPPAVMAEVRAAVAGQERETKQRPGGLLESPAFLIGLVCLLLGLAGGIPLMLLTEGALRIVGATVGGTLGLLGAVMVVLGVSRRSSGSGPSAPAPAAAPGRPAATLPPPPQAPPPTAASPAVPPPAPQAAPPQAPQAPAAPPAPLGAPQAPPPPPAPAPAGAPLPTAVQLDVTDGPDRGRSFVARGGMACMIGRAPSCLAVLTDPSISSQHAQVVFGGDGFYVEDLGSRNGVYVNSERIVNRQRLNAGDFIVIGSSRMRVSFL